MSSVTRKFPRRIKALLAPIVVFQGGLGNQLSQWSYAHSIVGSGFFLIDPLHNLHEVANRNFELVDVCENCEHVLKDKKGHFKIPKSRFFYRFLDRLWEFKVIRAFVEVFGYIREDPRIDQEQSRDISKVPRYAKGYFQKQANVEKVMSAVRIEIIPLVRRLLPDLIERFALTPGYTVFHVRRGDYEAAEFTPVNIGTLSDEFFIEGLHTVKPSNLVLLTENREDVSDLVIQLNPQLVLDKSETTPWETLAIIYGATKFLGSNSSLSWWGARLCLERGGDVWLPSQWSYWKNVNVGDFHFANCKIVDALWLQGKPLS